MEINGVTTPVTGVDTMWRHPLGACDSTVKKITDDTGEEWVEISRELSIRVLNSIFFLIFLLLIFLPNAFFHFGTLSQFGPEDKDTAGQDVDTSKIFFNTFATYRKISKIN